MRQDRVVRQKWDLSCGAAALSTLLTFDVGDRVSEADIITSILRRSDPVRIRARQGFSLLDLKRFAVSRGHVADGYGRLAMTDLARMSPAIVPTQIGGYNHFVVFRGVRDGHVLLADPAFGNRTMSVERFEALWPRRIAFVVRPGGEEHASSSHPVGGHSDLPVVPPSVVVREALGVLR
ncbi:MAG: C39 family peptidase [Anaeromyxobacteraceae bacterium]